MQGDACTGGIIPSARTGRGGAGSRVTAAQRGPLYMFPQRRTGRRTCLPLRKAVGGHDATAGYSEA